jgi:hypothetical protein
MSASSENQTQEQPSAAVAADPPLKREQEDGEDEEAGKRSKKNHEYNDLVSVLVGPDEVRYTVHEHKICAKSKFFEAACRKEWLERRQVPLPDVEPRLFEVYYDWVYDGEIKWDKEEDQKIEDQKIHVEAYIMGEFLDDEKFCSEIIKAMIGKLSKWGRAYSEELIWRIWDGTPSKSPLRKFLLQWMLDIWPRNDITDMVERLPPGFVAEAFLLLLGRTTHSTVPQCQSMIRSMIAKKK